MARSTEITDQIIAALGSIIPARGFNTDAGLRVVRGRAEALRVNQDDLPMIAISTITSTADAVKPRTVRKRREIEVVGLVDAGERDYEPGLDALDEDVSRALSPLTGIDEITGALSVEISGGEYRHPESGSNIAGVTHTVIVSYALTTQPQP